MIASCATPFENAAPRISCSRWYSRSCTVRISRRSAPSAGLAWSVTSARWLMQRLMLSIARAIGSMRSTVSLSSGSSSSRWTDVLRSRAHSSVETMASRSLGSSRPPRDAFSASGRTSWAPPRPVRGFSASSRRASAVSRWRRTTSRNSGDGSSSSASSRPAENDVCRASRSRILSNSSVRSACASMWGSVSGRRLEVGGFETTRQPCSPKRAGRSIRMNAVNVDPSPRKQTQCRFGSISSASLLPSLDDLLVDDATRNIPRPSDVERTTRLMEDTANNQMTRLHTNLARTPGRCDDVSPSLFAEGRRHRVERTPSSRRPSMPPSPLRPTALSLVGA